MIEDIIQPSDVSQLIQVHTDNIDCRACRQPDRMKKSIGRTYHKIKEFNANQDALAHCKHPQTKTILMRPYVEDERGVALDQPRDVEQCLGCAKLLWEKAS